MKKQQDTSDRAVEPSITRRATLAATAAAALSATPASGADTVADLIARVADKNAAFMRGDMQRWSDLVPIAPDFTLFQPFGGEATRGFDKRPERLADMSRYFRNGTSELEVVQVYASDDMIVLATVERQTGEVGDRPLQNWSLRVTEVWRRSASEWQLAHRHADPLVERRSLAATADLAKDAPTGGEASR
jgi:ketosteroid isomerase-like protein